VPHTRKRPKLCRCSVFLTSLGYLNNYIRMLKNTRKRAIETLLRKYFCCHLAITMLIFTVEIFRTSVKSFLVFFAFLSCSFLIAKSRRKDTCTMFNQKFHHSQIIARSGTMERGPTKNLNKYVNK